MGENPEDWGFASAGKKSRKRHSPDMPIIVPSHIDTAVAIDASITSCGWAIIKATERGYRRTASGAWKPSGKKIDRWVQLIQFIATIKDRYEVGNCACGVVEAPNPFQYRHAKDRSDISKINYGRAVGSVHAALLGSLVICYTPSVRQWKGTGSKTDTAFTVKCMFGIDCQTDDESDAIMQAVWTLDQRAAVRIAA